MPDGNSLALDGPLLNAGMEESADRRLKEARFMARFEDDLACRHSKLHCVPFTMKWGLIMSISITQRRQMGVCWFLK